MDVYRKWTRNQTRFTAALLSTFASGWNDACVGSILPSMERHYGVSSATEPCGA